MTTENFQANPINLDVSAPPIRNTIQKLPSYVQSPLLKKFWSTTVDQLMQPAAQENVSGYIGQRNGSYYKPATDFYINEATPDRQNYQLEPTAVSVDNNNNINFVQFYEDLVNSLGFDGALTEDQSRLFAEQYYSWCPPINPDMFLNFSNYYWITIGPQINTITDTTNAQLDIVGQQFYTTPSGLVFQSGMKVHFTNDANPEYNQISSFIVEGVGQSIVLIDDSLYDDANAYDVQPYDITPYDGLQVSSTPSYFTIQRGSQDGNPWSVNNRWFHKDVIGQFVADDPAIYVQASRPIIEYIKNIELRNFARYARNNVTLWSTSDEILNIVGASRYTIDNIALQDGFTILFTGDNDPSKNNRVYEVFGLDSFGEIGLELIIDGFDPTGSPVSGEGITVTNGSARIGANVYYNGTTWVEGQQKVSINQYPVFNLYDLNNIRLDSPVEYPDSNFNGNSLFTYATDNSGIIDPILDIELDVVSFDTIQFDNEISSVTYQYTSNNQTANIDGYYFYRIFQSSKDLGLDDYKNDWWLSSLDSRQYVEDQFIINQEIATDGIIDYQREFTLSITPDPNVVGQLFNLNVNLNGTSLIQNIDYSISNNQLQLSDTLNLNNDDVLDVLSWAQTIPQVNGSGFFQIPPNLQYNPNNNLITVRSYSDLIDQMISIISNQSYISGSGYGINNFNSTPRDLSRGFVILNHSASLLRTALLTGNTQTKLTDSIRYNDLEYITFKNKFLSLIQTFYTQGYSNLTPVNTWVTDAIAQINLGKTPAFPFFNSAMINGSSYIPSTPSALGITPVYLPKIFVDTTLINPITVIQGHDGSIVPSFGNFLDQVVLEYETEVYNAIDPAYKKPDSIFFYNTLQVRPGFFRTTDYSRSDWLEISKPGFERWTITQQIDYVLNNSFDQSNPFTWNYSGCTDPNGNFLPGSWRGIYQYFYDSFRPNTNPWELLGFSQEPSWWTSQYGPAPYTSGNLVLWQDLQQGIIRQGSTAGTYSYLARPGLTNYIPSDSQGNLLDPISIGITTAPNVIFAAENWSFGDIGPGEYQWYISSSYPFDLSEVLFLAKPAQFTELFWERRKLNFVNDQFYNTDFGVRPTSLDLTVHNQILTNGSLNTVRGISDWVSNYVTSQSLNINNSFTNLVQYLNAQLCYRAGAFIRNDDTLRLVSGNFGIITSDNYEVQLYKGASISQPVYSAVTVIWDGSVYRVTGYDVVDQNFLVLPIQSTGPNYQVTNGNVSVNQYTQFSSTPQQVLYYTGLTSRQAVYDFFVGYQAYLESQGWVFDDWDSVNNLPINFITSAGQFLTWSQVQLSAGDSIVFSPLSSNAVFQYTRGQVDNLQEFINGVYSVLDRTGKGISTSQFDVTRNPTQFQVTLKSSAYQGMHCLRLSLVEYEHIIVLDNFTNFDNLIYDPVVGIRLPRLTLLENRTQFWNGQPYALGFIVQGTGLVDNFENSVDNIRHFFDFDLQPSPGIQGELAQHVIGFQERPYMSNLLIDRNIEFDYYRGFIGLKGTLPSFTNILRSNYITQTANFNILEEWAFEIGEYGNLNNRQKLELQCLQQNFTTNPQLYEFVSTAGSNPTYIDITPNDPRWVLKNKSNLTNNQFAPRVTISPYTNYDSTGSAYTSTVIYPTDLPNAGYVQIGETTFTITYADNGTGLTNLFNSVIYANGTLTGNTFTDGNTIWFVITDNGGWDVQRICEGVQISAIGSSTGTNTPVVTTTGSHGLSQGQTIILQSASSTSPNLQGIQTVGSVLSGTSFVLANTTVTAGTTYGTSGQNIYYLQSVRYPNIGALNAATPPTNGWLSGDEGFVDNNSSTGVYGFWTVYSRLGTGWSPLRSYSANGSSDGLIDISQLFTVYLYNNVTDEDIIQLELYDPFKGYIFPSAKAEIAYQQEFDPATYNTGTSPQSNIVTGDNSTFNIDSANVWNSNQVGQLWWDLSTTRFLYYEQENLDYKRQYWGQIVPGTVIDIYEWTKSPVLPENWSSYVSSNTGTGPGTPSGTVPLGTNTPYVQLNEFDPQKNATVTFYYFWVLNPSNVPQVNFRSISALSVSELITNPNNTQDIAWFSPIDTYSFLVGNLDQFANTVNSVLQITLFENQQDSIIHKQWLLLRDDDTETPPYLPLWNKMRDSLVGFDDLNLSVPDTSLSSVVIYGTKFRPRQTWFVNRLEARFNFFDKANNIMATENVVSIEGYNTQLNAIDPLPSPDTYNYKVASRADRDALDGSIPVNSIVLVVNDEDLNGFWSTWLYVGGTNWTITGQQQYAVNGWWSFVDWYAPGYSSSTRINFEVANIATMNANTNQYVNGNVIKVDNNGAGGWSLYLYTVTNGVGTFSAIAEQNGTININSTGLTDYDITNTILDKNLSTVTKILISALLQNILTIIQQNQIFFTMVRYVHTEQTIVPWVFKTSLTIGQGIPIPLDQPAIQPTDVTSDLLNFFNEAKPYHTTLRTLQQAGSPPIDETTVTVSDSRLMNINLIFDRVTGTSNIPNGANPADYDINSLTAADRVQLFYAPTEGMPPKVLSQLISRVEFGGTIIDGKGFYQFGTLVGAGYDNSSYDGNVGGYDFTTTDIEQYYDIFANGGDPLGTIGTFGQQNGSATIVINGNQFVQPLLDPNHPEELTLVRSGDALMINVFTTDVQVVPVGYDNEAYDSEPYDQDSSSIPINAIRYPKILLKIYNGTASSGPFAIGQLPQNQQAIFVYKNGTLLTSSQYTINYVQATITLSSSLIATDYLTFYSFGPGGSQIVEQEVYYHTSSSTFNLKTNITNSANIFATVDGQIASVTTSGTTVTIVSPTPSNSTVLIVNFLDNTYSTVTTQSTTSTGGAQLITFTSPPEPTQPAYDTVQVYDNGTLLSPPTLHYYVSNGTNTIYNIQATPSAPNLVQVWFNGVKQSAGTNFARFFLTNIAIATPGSNYTVGNIITGTGSISGNGYNGTVNSINGTGGITGITTINPGTDYQGTVTLNVSSITGVGAAFTSSINGTQIQTLGSIPAGTDIVVLDEENGQYTIVNNNTQVNIPSTTLGDTIKLTTYSDDIGYGMATETFVGNAAGTYQLGGTPFDTNSLIVYVDGVYATLGVNYQYSNGLISFPANTQTFSDKIVAIYFTGLPVEPNIAFTIYKDIFGNYSYLRISDANTTTLTAPLANSDTTVIVNDATVLTQPNLTNKVPGVVNINGERIIFWSVNTSTAGSHQLLQCMRGTGGTIINNTLGTGTLVRDAGVNEVIPGGYQWSYTPHGLQYSNNSVAQFLLASPGSVAG